MENKGPTIPTPEEFATAMQDAFGDSSDPEQGHINADVYVCEVLTALGYGEGIAIFEAARRWYA